MSNCNTQGLWSGMKSLTGYGIINTNFCGTGLNVNDFSASHDSILASLVQNSNVDCSPATVLHLNEVWQQLRCLKTRKAAGTDGTHPHTLKVCANQLCSVLHSIFSMSVSL